MLTLLNTYWAVGGLVEAGTLKEALTLPIGLPWAPMRMQLDGLSAFFLVVVNLLGFLAALYGLGYGEKHPRAGRVLTAFPLFLAGMNLVPLADDAFAFVIGWEVMSLASWALVLSSHEDGAARRAAYVYLVMAVGGAIALTVAFGLLGGLGSHFAFADIRNNPPTPTIAVFVLVLAIIGAGGKAGVAPLHAWLPLAHPAAPSHVSALMSGAMTKVAIYGLIRILFDLVGTPVWWWGAVLVLLGCLTAVIGILYAIIEQDLKTLLAYSTVKNIGFIVTGLGLSLAFAANDMKPLAALALAAALLHVLNHGLFKALLFMGAGTILHATGTRDLGRLGGLVRLMPKTAILFLIGAAAISALPPLNGFASEWLLFQAALAGVALPQWLLKFTVPVAVTLLALAAALSAAAFARAFGMAFLGRPRDPLAEPAHDPAGPMIWAMALAAAGCIGVGLAPGPVLEPIVAVATPIARAAHDVIGLSAWAVTPFRGSSSTYGALPLALGLAGVAGVVWLTVRLLANRATRRSAPWDCGFPVPAPDTQYGPSSFAMPVRRVYNRIIYVTRPTVDMPAPGEVRPAGFELPRRDRIWDWLYEPIADWVEAASQRANKLQHFTIRGYLSLMFAALVILLTAVAVTQQ